MIQENHGWAVVTHLVIVSAVVTQVFLQRSAVNLLSTVLDTPEFFWSAPDQLQALYERACEYLELETRVEVLNARFMVSAALLVAHADIVMLPALFLLCGFCLRFLQCLHLVLPNRCMACPVLYVSAASGATRDAGHVTGSAE